MSAITRGNYPKALRPGVKKWWGRSYEEHQTCYTDLFDTDTSDKSYEELVEATGFGLAPVKPEGEAMVFDSESQGTITRATNVAYALGFIVTHEEIKDNKYAEVGKTRATALARSFRSSKEIVHANVYNRATNSSYTFGDGKELLATDHPTLDGTQSNELAVAADISEAALEDIGIQIMNAKNSRGLRIRLMPRSLILPTALFFEGHRILDSVQQNDSANNAINVLKSEGMFPEGIKVNPYLDDADQWFARTNVAKGTGLVSFQREEISFDLDNESTTKNALFMGYERYVPTCGDFRAIFGSPGQ